MNKKVLLLVFIAVVAIIALFIIIRDDAPGDDTQDSKSSSLPVPPTFPEQ